MIPIILALVKNIMPWEARAGQELEKKKVWYRCECQTPCSLQIVVNSSPCRRMPVRKWRVRLLSLALGDLCSLNGRHLLSPALSRLRLLYGTQVVSCKARDAHVVVAFQDELDVSNLESGGWAQFGETAGCGDDIVDKVVSHLEDELHQVSII